MEGFFCLYPNLISFIDVKQQIPVLKSICDFCTQLYF